MKKNDSTDITDLELLSRKKAQDKIIKMLKIQSKHLKIQKQHLNNLECKFEDEIIGIRTYFLSFESRISAFENNVGVFKNKITECERNMSQWTFPLKESLENYKTVKHATAQLDRELNILKNDLEKSKIKKTWWNFKNR